MAPDPILVMDPCPILSPGPILVIGPGPKSGVNGVAVAPQGLIFGEDGATGSRKVSGWLRDLRDIIQNSKNVIFQNICKFGISKNPGKKT